MCTRQRVIPNFCYLEPTTAPVHNSHDSNNHFYRVALIWDFWFPKLNQANQYYLSNKNYVMNLIHDKLNLISNVYLLIYLLTIWNYTLHFVYFSFFFSSTCQLSLLKRGTISEANNQDRSEMKFKRASIFLYYLGKNKSPGRFVIS